MAITTFPWRLLGILEGNRLERLAIQMGHPHIVLQSAPKMQGKVRGPPEGEELQVKG